MKFSLKGLVTVAPQCLRRQSNSFSFFFVDHPCHLQTQTYSIWITYIQQHGMFSLSKDLYFMVCYTYIPLHNGNVLIFLSYKAVAEQQLCSYQGKQLTCWGCEHSGGCCAGVGTPLGAGGHITIQKPLCWVTFPSAAP